MQVTAQSRAYGNSDKAVAVATTPFGLDFNIKPSAVVDLKGYKKRAGVVNLTWKSPANFAGVDSYEYVVCHTWLCGLGCPVHKPRLPYHTSSMPSYH